MLTVCYILSYFSFIESFLIQQELFRIYFFALTLRIEVQCHKDGLEVISRNTSLLFYFLDVFNTLLYIYIEPNKAKGHNYSPLSKWPPLKWKDP